MSDTTPVLSVVVPSVNGWSDLERCLEALERQSGDVTEVLVADRVGAAVREPAARRFPRMKIIPAAPGTTIPQLRAMAFEQARGRLVGVIEDHVLVPDDWAGRMIAAHDEGAQVVGGSVRNAATGRLVDRAAFLCEYSHCLAPPSGPADWVTGNNVTYRRDLLMKYAETWRSGGWENLLHDAMRRDGIQLISRPDIVVDHMMHYSVGLYMEQRYLYSRSWAGTLARTSGIARRLAMGAASLALPPLLFARVAARVWKTGRYRAELIESLPLLALFTISWAWGEVVGWWAGPGDALARVR